MITKEKIIEAYNRIKELTPERKMVVYGIKEVLDQIRHLVPEDIILQEIPKGFLPSGHEYEIYIMEEINVCGLAEAYSPLSVTVADS